MPDAVAYDWRNGEVYIVNSQTSNVAVVNASTYNVVGWIAVGNTPTAIAYDDINGYLYVGWDGPSPQFDYASGGVTVINASTNQVVTTELLPGYSPPVDIVVNNTSGEVYLSSWTGGTAVGSGSVTIMSGTSQVGSIDIPDGPAAGMAWDSENGKLFVAFNGGVASVNMSNDSLATAVRTGYISAGADFDPSDGQVYVVSFVYLGWLNVINGTDGQLDGNFGVCYPPQAVAYSVQTGDLYISCPGQLEVVDPSNGTIVASIADSFSCPTNCEVYDYEDLAIDPANSTVFLGDYDGGPNVTVVSTTTNSIVDTIYLGPPLYSVTFAEANLPPGTQWWVNITGQPSVASTASVALASLPNASYSYSPGSANDDFVATAGTFEVDGAPTIVSVQFSRLPLTISPSADPVTVGAPVPAPATITFKVGVKGGTPPYSFAWSFGDGTSSPAEYSNHTYANPGTYLATIKVTDSAGVSVSANETVELGSPGEVTAWVPALDAYDFPNSGSLWDSGNCYGMSSTALLYFAHYELGVVSDPYYPDAFPYYPNPLPDLSAAGVPQQGWLGQWNSFDNVTLAIFLHQESSQNAFLATPNGLTDSAVLAALSTGWPVVIGMTGVSGKHAVVAYGAQTYANGSVEFSVSDPNSGDAAETSYAWFTPPETFSYIAYGDSFDTFDPMVVSPLQFSLSEPWTITDIAPSSLLKWFNGGWQLVESTTAVTVTSNGQDSFSDSDGGNSETFSYGISGSAGVEEGSVQAYAIPPGDSYVDVADPSQSTSAAVEILAGGNQSDTPTFTGFLLNLSSASSVDYTIRDSSDGFVLETGPSELEANVTVYSASMTRWDDLKATALSFGPASKATFSIVNSSALNSTVDSSISVTVSSQTGSGPGTRYEIKNGQSGLGAPVSSPSASSGILGLPGVDGYLVVGGAVAAVVAVPLVLGLTRHKSRPPPPRSGSSN